VRFDHQLVPLDFNTPLDMRAPGAAWGVYALECAVDELAHAAKIDPLEVRLRNYAERDANGTNRFHRKNCAPVTRKAPSVSAGRADGPSRARCAKVAS